MTDRIDGASPQAASPPPVVSLDQFDVQAINDSTTSLRTVDCQGLYTLFERSFGVARAEGDPIRMAVLQLLADATSIFLRPADKGAEWSPRLSVSMQRTSMPQDLRGEQSHVLAQLAPLLVHPGLRARLADLAWTNDRKLGKSAALAIESYCECAERLVSGRSVPSFDAPGLAAAEALQHVERALVLGFVTRARRVQPERTVAALKAVYALSQDRNELGTFVKVAGMGIGYDLMEKVTVAAEAAADRVEPGKYPLAAKMALDLAGQLYEQCGDADGRRRCQLKGRK